MVSIVTSILNCICTVVLAILTGWYVILTRRMLSVSLPVPAVYVEFRRATVSNKGLVVGAGSSRVEKGLPRQKLMLAIVNSGSAAAYKVRLDVIKEEISYLAPGQEMQFQIDPESSIRPKRQRKGRRVGNMLRGGMDSDRDLAAESLRAEEPDTRTDSIDWAASRTTFRVTYHDCEDSRAPVSREIPMNMIAFVSS